MRITRTSTLTGTTHICDIDITEEQLYQVNNRRDLGLLIQKIVPHLSLDDREFLLSGITATEWEEHFGKMDDYNEEKYVDETTR
jgi:hypothetical protein